MYRTQYVTVRDYVKDVEFASGEIFEMNINSYCDIETLSSRIEEICTRMNQRDFIWLQLRL
jgi:hypothetical protein